MTQEGDLHISLQSWHEMYGSEPAYILLQAVLLRQNSRTQLAFLQLSFRSFCSLTITIQIQNTVKNPFCSGHIEEKNKTCLRLRLEPELEAGVYTPTLIPASSSSFSVWFLSCSPCFPLLCTIAETQPTLRDH